MKRQIQPNKWSCLPTAFAMFLDIPVDKFIERVGHDGSAIMCPLLEDPERRMGFTIQEMIAAALPQRISQLDSVSVIYYADGTVVHRSNDLSVYLNNKAVIVGQFNGQAHAAAWDGVRVWNPNGTNHNLDNVIIDGIFV